METPFIPKPTETPKGDPAGQAIASLRGYAYQLIASGVAWLKLADDEELYLEVAQDYATAARAALDAVQVKDTQSNVTINSAGIRQAIDDFVDLAARNPGRRVTLRFLSTSEIGKEQKVEDRVGAEPTLKYWAPAAEGAGVPPLRTILTKLELDPRTRAFIEAGTTISYAMICYAASPGTVVLRVSMTSRNNLRSRLFSSPMRS
jgi:hypothetical protein